ncbi:G-patch domain-containing protein [Capsicum chinense]|nr:G-patch domain-containing protein [Capsicum chinense]
MGGNNRKRSNKPKNRKPRNPTNSGSGRGLFVEGGVLSDWDDFNSPPSGRNLKSENVKSRNCNAAVSSSKNASGSKSEPKRSRRNEIRYVYSSADSVIGSDAEHSGGKDNKLDLEHPIVLVDTKETQIVAFVDEGPSKEPQNEGYIYDCTTPLSLDVRQNKDSNEAGYAGDYSAGFSLDESSHRGLGFYEEAETTHGGVEFSSKEEKENPSFESSFSDEDMGADGGFLGGASIGKDDHLPAEMSSSVENEGFLSIGGLRLYTQDVSDEESDGDGEDISSEDGSSCSSESEGSSESDGSSDSDSDVDEEVAADYFKGTGGMCDVIDVKQLVGQVPSSCSDDSLDETVEKLGGIDLQEASREYGMKKTQKERKYRGGQKSTSAKQARGSDLDDLMFVKDSRTVSGKKKHAAKFPQSWPFESHKSKNFGRIPGAKKKHRKEMMALKRRERMLRRGVDLRRINSKLQQMVLDGADMFSFQPMYPRDCSQVQRLAAIYRLRSGCQGSGKKRFVTVTKTQHTAMPSASDKIRLEKLIGADDEDSDFTVTGLPSHRMDVNAAKNFSKGSGGQSGPSKVFKTPVNPRGQKDTSKKRRDQKTGSYAALPVSFVSSGIMRSETEVEEKSIEATQTTTVVHETKVVTNSIEYGAFEMHTTGFGSKMMAKMGYQEGRGLGKDGQGIAEPIEARQRPKALGLGAEIPETSSMSSGKKDSLPKSALLPGAEVVGRSGKSIRKEESPSSVGFAGFERHTKGFGSKMMAKMGFVEGMGLGRNSQGITNPLVAVRRPKSQGLGAKR